MPKCSNCGTELNEGQKFCFECGAPAPQVKKCPSCQSEIPLKMKFCPECGYNFNASASAAGTTLGMGDKNVIAGDVNQNITNTTINNVIDQTKSVNSCAICGVHMTNDNGHTCPKCGKVVCSEHFDKEYLCCTNCAKLLMEAKDAEASFTDPRDGQVYKTVKYGNQVWLAENFRYSCDGSYAYDDDKKNVKKYGRLYTWEAARNCAPEGWHLPTKEDFAALESYVDAHTDNAVGTALKSMTDDWEADEATPKGTDEIGFCALPAGYRNYEGGFDDGSYADIGSATNFWTVDDDGGDYAFFRNLCYDGKVFFYDWGQKKDAYSVRFVRD